MVTSNDIKEYHSFLPGNRYDKSAIKLPDEKITPDEKISLAYIPLYCPVSHVVVKKPRPVEILPCEADVVVHVNPTSSSISQFLTTPVALSEKPVSRFKPFGGVITSSAYITEMEKRATLKRGRKTAEKE